MRYQSLAQPSVTSQNLSRLKQHSLAKELDKSTVRKRKMTTKEQGHGKAKSQLASQFKSWWNSRNLRRQVTKFKFDKERE